VDPPVTRFGASVDMIAALTGSRLAVPRRGVGAGVPPTGERAIATLAVGDLVYSVDRGQLSAVPIAMVHRNPARAHHAVRIELEGGAVLEISAPHPTADGRHFGDLHRGDLLDGKRILTTAAIPYSYAFTYDILPASDSGTYVAGGVLIGSTLGGSAFSFASSMLGGGIP
jgi:hypothetical protein